MAHAHLHGQSHAPSADADSRRLAAALGLILVFMAAEVVAAIFADSLALLSDAGHMLTDAVAIGLALGALRLIASAERRSLNIEGANKHILTDLFAFIATAVAGLIIVTTGFERADGIASLLVAASMLWASYGLLRESGRVFMEAAPRELDPETIGNALAAEQGVMEVHDLHVWEVTTGMPAVSAHIIVGRDDDCHRARFDAARLLADRFGVEHSTLQVEHRHDEGELLQID